MLITRTYAIYVIRFHLTASLRLLKQKLTKNSDIFNVTFKDDVVRFEIDKAYIPKNQKAYVHEEYVGILQNFYMGI